MNKQPPVCDYEESDYQSRFWLNQGREYEDLAERIALRRLLPPAGRTVIDIGAGFGRLADEYQGYAQVVLFDYSRSLLAEAQERLDGDDRFIYVAGNWYKMPFVDGLFEAMVQVRTIHHAADVPRLFRQLARIAAPGADYVLEYANKKNFKAMLRYWAGRQSWSPFAPEPVEFVALNYDFHPCWMDARLREAGFEPGRKLTVSHYRVPILKRIFPARFLAFVDGLAQYSGNWWQLTPSVFVISRAPDKGKRASPGAFFACPECQTPLEGEEADHLACSNEVCGLSWQVKGGIYDFKEPVPR